MRLKSENTEEQTKTKPKCDRNKTKQPTKTNNELCI